MAGTITTERAAEIRERADMFFDSIERGEKTTWRYDFLRGDVPEMLAEIERLRAALAWYADDDNYRGLRAAVFNLASPAENDRGERAREALGEETDERE